jgi:hypothetical protein
MALKEHDRMDKKDCFGSIKEVSVNQSHTMTLSKHECRNCEEIRDCLRLSKQLEEEERERDELRKQNVIAQMIDHSHVISNELGSCLLEFLSRIYSSPLGSVLLKNLFFFYEIPKGALSSTLTIPISQTIMHLIQGEKEEAEDSPSPPFFQQRREPKGGFALRIFLLQKSFPNLPKANMGLIAYEVARAFASDDLGIKQILQVLSDSETDLFKRMDVEARMKWLIGKWGFLDEFEALKKEMAAGT